MTPLRPLILLFALALSPSLCFAVEKVCVLGLAEQRLPTEFELRSIDEKIALLEKLDGKSTAEVEKAVQMRTETVLVADGRIGSQIVQAPKKAHGFENLGIYLYTDPLGTKRVVKVLNHGPEVRTNNDLRQTLLGSYLMEKAGGPKIYGYGKIDIPLGTARRVQYYLDMEQLPDGISLKQMSASDVSTIASTEARKKVAEQVALRLIDVFEKAISPSDPDFWVQPSGDLRWIDGPRWRKTDFSKADIAYFSQILWFFLKQMTLFDDESNPTRHGAHFLKTFFSGLKNSSVEASVKGRIARGMIDFPSLMRVQLLGLNEAQKILFLCAMLSTPKIDADSAAEALAAHIKGWMQ